MAAYLWVNGLCSIVSDQQVGFDYLVTWPLEVLRTKDIKSSKSLECGSCNSLGADSVIFRILARDLDRERKNTNLSSVWTA